MHKLKPDKTTITLFIVAIILLIYGYLCRSLSLYFFWESKFIGWMILFAAIAFLLVKRIQSGKKEGRKRIFEKIVMYVLGFILVVQAVLYSVLSNSDAYQSAKRFITTDEDVRAEVGEVKSVSLIPLGQISSSADNEGESGEAAINVIVKGSKRFMDMTLLMEKEKEGGWAVKDVY